MENTDDRIIRVFIVRHGQTDWNINKILQGHKDIPLNKIGELQAKLLGKRFANENIKFDCWISSDLTRCIQTTKGIEEMINNKDQIPERIIKDSSFRERYMGEVEGMKIDDARDKYGDNFRNLGETKDEMISRIYRSWISCLENCANEGDKNVLLCTHGGVIRNFVNYLHSEKNYKLASGLARDDLRVPYNTSVTVVDVYRDNVEGGGVIERFGCTLHLGEQREVVDKDLR